MMPVCPFLAVIEVGDEDRGNLVTDRVACRYPTHVAMERQNVHDLMSHRQYRLEVLRSLRDTCTDLENSDKLVTKFLNLAGSLEHAKGVALPTGYETFNDREEGFLQDAWSELLHEETACGGKLLPQDARLLQQRPICQGLLHPLLIVLLAYQIGGPINAVNTAYAHQWKLPKQSRPEVDMQNFHMEGENGDVLIFDDHRLTLVWEERDGNPRSVSGNHHLFLCGQGSQPQPLQTASLINSDEADTLTTILYNSRSAALVYGCEDPKAVRHSISLDFHLHTMTDELLDVAQLDLEHTTLGDLILNFTVSNYSNHFHRLLFSSESVKAIMSKLSDIDMPPTQPYPSPTHQIFLQRLDAYKRENLAHIPFEILSMDKDIAVCGTHASIARFLATLSLRARRDVHLPLGWDLFPQDPIEENREWARKYIRDMPDALLSQRLAKHAEVLARLPYAAKALLSTAQLQSLATMIEMHCLELISNGFIDKSCILPSMASLVAALGKSLNGPKELQICLEPHVDELDLQVYRTRCLHLFWCADWLEDYLGNPMPGPFMIVEVKQGCMTKMKGEVESMARALVRNWAVWGCFVEGLPKGEFCVRQG